jgi:hypothetical protein
MTPDDRELLRILRGEELALRRSLTRLEERLSELEARAGTADHDHAILPPPLSAELPPVPEMREAEPIEHLFPPYPSDEHALPPVPPILPHPLPPIPEEPKPSFEFQVGRWLTRIGALFFVLFLVSADAYFGLHRLIGPWGKLGLMGAVSMVIVAVGQRLDRKAMAAYGRTLMAAGLAGLYFTLYAAASIDQLRVVHQPVVGGFLLLLWSAYVLYLADSRQSQLLALFAIALAYISSALNPLVSFTMAADLLLAATAVIFFLRRGWAVLSYLALAGTYLALLHRLVVNEDNELVFDTSRSLAFTPHAIYLVGAWVIFTAAVLLSRTSEFRSGMRFAFLTLNNGAGGGLLVLAAYICGYGADRMGNVLLLSGLVLLATAAISARVREDAPDVTGAYVAQGIAVTTGGVMAVYTGATRGILLIIETLFLGMAGAFARSRILTVCAWATAFFATLFLLWEIGVNARDPWLLGIGGSAVMFKNAWWSRRKSGLPPDTQTLIPGASYYCALGLSLIGVLLNTEMSAAMLPPTLALVALICTFSVYPLRLFELPPLAQALLLVAQVLVLFPVENGETLPGWSTALVAGATLLMVLWWSFQKVMRLGVWLNVLDFVYALALVGMSYQAIRPHLHEQLWMLDASLLSVAFLAFGALTRVWSIAAMGQVFLGISLYHFFQLNHDPDRFPWTAWAAAIPLTVVFATGRSIHAWLRAFPAITGERRQALRGGAYLYQLVALLMLVRCIVGLVPPAIQLPIFVLLGTVILTLNVRRSRAFGVRCSFVLSGLGALLYAWHFQDGARALATFLNALAILSFLTQPAILHHALRRLMSEVESWALVLVSAATGWFYCADSLAARMGNGSITVGWAVYALLLFFLGLLLHERRQRWCGLAILVAAIVRVFAVDFWGLTNGYRVLTFIVLTIITLGLGFIYARYGERLKTLL